VKIMSNIVECSICKKEKEKNICILGKCICKECENDIIACNVSDLHYEELKDAIKDILFAAKER